MDGKDMLENLIISYLLGELDEQEQADVLERIRSDEKSRQVYNDLKKTVKLVAFKHTVDNTDLDKEWNNFEETKRLRNNPELFLHEAERFGNGIIKELSLKKKTRLFRIISFSAVSACIVLAIGWGLTFMAQQKKTNPAVANLAREKRTGTNPVIRHLVNNLKAAKQYLLEDGTVVQLAAGSELDFREPFEAGRRDIYLNGSAHFTVAKNKHKPFTVYSGGISTTALGTRFTVTAFKNSGMILVALHEGKVVVKGVGEWKKEIKKDYYLVPGQQFVFEKKLRTLAYVENSYDETGETQHELKPAGRLDMAADKPSIPSFGKGSWYMFNNQSLYLVFDHLQKVYNTEIVYNKNDIEKMYFIGTFKQSDSLEVVLKQIAATNDLTIKKEQRKFIVTK